MHKQELAGPDIFVVHDFLSRDECWQFVARSEAAGFGDAPINAGIAGAVVRKDVRNNERVMIDDWSLARDLWARAKAFVPPAFGRWHAVGLNERFRFYRYDPGQRFTWHFDGPFERDVGDRSRLTFMLYLNDDFEGGETQFNLSPHNTVRVDDPMLRVTPKSGQALVFQHAILHQGATVTKGRKYVLRTDVMYRFGGAE
ncbi:prolyl hydroxylase family protein [Fimbriiglobus ruber]|uniref:WD-repeat protein n=1 Tax=Fimbriiglobus ruber TaxID=1908690 RepID=A0A225DJT2_9BACT|nr:2OG-Fe(II) oxygenase [Fimbriiglobus ruber]OWK37696.1 WD-repeat protein [Fimbriiglobus ruber]